MCLAIVLPTYDHFDYALRALETFFTYSPPDSLCAVVDDATPGWETKRHVFDEFRWSQKLESRLSISSFIGNGGLTRSWNYGLEIFRKCDNVTHIAVANSDVVFAEQWYVALLNALEPARDGGRYDLVGPVSNAPGVTAKGDQEVEEYYPEYRLTDEQGYLNDVSREMLRRFPHRIIEGPINGFFMMAQRHSWFDHAYDESHVFRPRNDFNSKGLRNPTPLMTLNEDELQGRWHKQGLRSGIVLGSFLFHYRAVSRGDRYRHGKWYRRPQEETRAHT